MDAITAVNELNQGTSLHPAGAVAGNSNPEGAGSLQDEVNRMIQDNHDRPGFMYDNPPFNPGQVAPQEQAPQAQTFQQPVQQAPVYAQQQAPQYDQMALVNELQMERSRNSALSQKAELLSAYEEALAHDPDLANRFVSYFTAPQGSTQAEQVPQQGQAVGVSPLVRRQMEQLSRENEYNRSMIECMQLERDYPGVFNKQSALQYKQQQGFRSVTDAFHHMLGAATGQYLQQQHRMQYANYYGMQQPQQQQQAQYVPQQYQTQQQAPRPQPLSSPPPQAQSDAVVMRPGSQIGAEDPLDNFKPDANPDKGWKQVQALMMHDMRKWKQQGLY